MKIASVAGSFPPYYFTQQQVFEELHKFWEKSLPDPDLIARFHNRVGVNGRYFSRPLEDYRALDTLGKTNDVWIEVAEQIGEQAIQCALARAGLNKSDISALLVVSVTGISSPSLDAHLINRMGLPRTTRRTPIFGLGCVAGASGIAQAADYVRAYPDRVAVLLSVELCSLTWQRNDISVANLIACSLFGDGAAAVVVTGEEVNSTGPAIVDTATNFYPGTEDAMGWDISEEGFRIVLSPEVPAIVKKHLPEDVDSFLASHQLTRADIGSWILHTGGPKVLEAMTNSLGISREACDASWESLQKMGNLSSASVLMVLEDVMLNHRPKPGTWGILAAVGPGFCSQLVLLRW
jgi:alkylresorcinol/alkylpyrone synthase